MKSLEALIDVEQPAWLLVREWVESATNAVEVLPPAASRGETLLGLQVTLGSTLGAIAYETGGLLIDHGWLRLLGSGHPRLPRSLVRWNFALGVVDEGQPPPFLLVADDLIGGFFAVDGGVWGTERHVHYFAPDTLTWEDLGRGYTDFVRWTLGGDLASFYADYRWAGWRRDASGAPGDQAYSLAPPPITRGVQYQDRDRALVPVDELYHLHQDLGRQVKDLPDGAPITFVVKG